MLKTHAYGKLFRIELIAVNFNSQSLIHYSGHIIFHSKYSACVISSAYNFF